ncbi:hypothetical protein A33K_13440 [Burkholderia humptydooensis MSMB43]|uniref:Uncharacterized protein n=1 Tax=Burkholderia humptydooensis MSMB43 TaxID=441157 RepID=A0ABN0GD03_9BURK|nr:hypothetical protein A33K_13440 [Burkholderia humptydooensis MSMB43]
MRLLKACTIRDASDEIFHNVDQACKQRARLRGAQKSPLSCDSGLFCFGAARAGRTFGR